MAIPPSIIDLNDFTVKKLVTPVKNPPIEDIVIKLLVIMYIAMMCLSIYVCVVCVSMIVSMRSLIFDIKK